MSGSLILILAGSAAAELWRAPVHTLTYVQVEKRLRDPLLDAEQTAGLPPSEVFAPLPADVEALLGPLAVDYESFTATYLTKEEAGDLLEAARAHDLVVLAGLNREIRLPWHTFEAGSSEDRTPQGFPLLLQTSRAIPGLYLVQFAYPLQEAWLTALETCGVQRIADLGDRTLLARAASLDALTSCGVSQYVSWIDSYLNTDRVSPEIFQDQDGTSADYQLQFIPGTDLRVKGQGLGPSLLPHDELDEVEEQMGFLPVRGKSEDLAAFVANDSELLSVTYKGEIAPSDERQGQIVAGNHNGTAPTGPGYRNWLSSRGLNTPSNQQTVGIIDDGYDDGTDPDSSPITKEHHPDLETPQRLLAPVGIPFQNAVKYDVSGHGTMVAGIIAGEGSTGTKAKDAQGYFYGSGIAPDARLVAARTADGYTLSRLTQALDYCRFNIAHGVDRAFIINNSYNGYKDISGIRFADNEYDEYSRLFDDKTNDGSTVNGTQPATLVFSAGNFAYDYATATIRRDSIASPATAKNVITVGATASYRPTPEPPLACQENPNGFRPPNQDANHIAKIGLFSGRGKSFGPSPSTAMVHNVRVKPDLVAPGVRVFSTVPYASDKYTTVAGCTEYYPLPNVNFYTYGTGTSFSAPVVTGVAALKRKWFLDRGVDPSPSLLKASLIATADSLGSYVGNDHRPSSNSGWGRVNLNRATNARARFYVKDNQSLAVSTGQQRVWTRTIDSPASDTYIVLAWSDPKTDLTGNSQVPLKNNLGLAIEELGSTKYWRGNNFRENRIGNDNGYSYRFLSLTEVPFSDSINNVEAVFIPANTFASGQKLTIKITGENVTAGAQKFSIYAYNVRPNQ